MLIVADPHAEGRRADAGARLAFACDDDALAQFESRVSATGAAVHESRVDAMVALAWHLRQRDAARAAALVAEAGRLVAALPAAHRSRHAARLALVQGEVDWLAGRLALATSHADAALDAFRTLDDPLGCADAHWLRAMLAVDRGDWPAMQAALLAMVDSVRGRDADRVDIGGGAQAYFASFRDSVAAHALWGARFAAGKAGLSTAAGCWAEGFLAVCAHHASDFVPAIRHFIEAHELALASGQPRRAVIAATNTGDSLNHLNDGPGALGWMQRGLEIARAQGGPGAMGVALLQTAHTLRLLDQADAAREMLHEALVLMAPLAASRNHAYAMWQLVELELATGRPAAALATALELGGRADALRQSDLQSHARCGEARALLALGRPAEALAAAERAVAHGEGAPNLQVAGLRVMADAHAAHPLPAPAGVAASSVALHYLLQALALADGIARLTVPGELLEAIAREHARLGDFRAAYDFSRRASVSLETSRSVEARNRAVAMQVTHETERARAEADHQRRLALTNAERLATLEQLGAIGREITRNLEPRAIFAALDQHVQALLDATALVIHRVTPDERALERVFGASSPPSIALDDPELPAARCARERREVEAIPAHDDTQAIGLMCVPLLVADRLLGVMSLR